MKVNLNVPFMNYKGLVITKKVEGTDVEQEQLMKDVIAPILFSGEWRDERVNALRKWYGVPCTAMSCSVI